MSGDEFVAIRKYTPEEAVTQNVKPTAEKRQERIENAPKSTNAPRLKRIGLKQINPAGSRYIPLPEDVAAFQRLDYLGAYIINAPDEKTEQKAKALLDDDYYIIPNISLSLPEPLPAEAPTQTAPEAPRYPDFTGIPLAWEAGNRGRGVRVGVLDTGCDSDHAEFSKRAVEFIFVDPTDTSLSGSGKPFDSDEHGTAICSIIAGNTLGIAPEVDLMVAAVIESQTVEVTLDRILFALDWMLSTFQDTANLDIPTIINLSLGFHIDQLRTPKLRANVRTALRSALATLVYEFDVLPIAAIGNDGAGEVRAPGYFPEVLSVGAVDFEQRVASFSGGGKGLGMTQIKPELVGLGVDLDVGLPCVDQTESCSRYGVMSGTSFATAYVTGIAALMASENPDLQGVALKRKMIKSALRLNEPRDRVGNGLARFEPASAKGSASS